MPTATKEITTMKITLLTLIHSIALPVLGLSLLCSTAQAADANAEQQLQTAVNGTWRATENRARDQYRHPLQTLTFFGVKPNATVIELFPGSKAYYSEILAPLLSDKGQYVVINNSERQADADQQAKKFAAAAHFKKVKVLSITSEIFNFGTENSADMVLTFRNVHNFAMGNKQSTLFAEIFKVLKPGGVLGVVDHRAAAGKTFAEVKDTGYIPEAFVIAEAEQAGFKLDASSAINNNSQDTKDYAKGVWTLPPTLAEGEKDRAKYLAIGESDRFTLRFVKPKK
jgi:predicted methyltransferase